MIYGLYAIRDMSAGVFTAPTVDINDKCAIRNFEQAMSNSNGMMHFRPSDFALYKIGDFDYESGLVIPITPIQMIMTGDNCEVTSNEV